MLIISSNTIKERRRKRQEHLKELKSARRVMNISSDNHFYAHVCGRIREVEDEINYLEMIVNDLNEAK